MLSVWSFTYPSEAYPLIAKLREENIPCTLSNEHVVLIDPLISNAVGGVKLLVPETEAERAKAIIEDFFKPAQASIAPLDAAFRESHDEVAAWCPACETYPVYRKKFTYGKTALAVFLTLLSYPLALLFLSKTHTCARCNFQWKR